MHEGAHAPALPAPLQLRLTRGRPPRIAAVHLHVHALDALFPQLRGIETTAVLTSRQCDIPGQL